MAGRQSEATQSPIDVVSPQGADTMEVAVNPSNQANATASDSAPDTSIDVSPPTQPEMAETSPSLPDQLTPLAAEPLDQPGSSTIPAQSPAPMTDNSSSGRGRRSDKGNANTRASRGQYLQNNWYALPNARLMNGEPWTEEEDLLLWYLRAKKGWNAKMASKYMYPKSHNSCSNRWTRYKGKFIEAAQSSFKDIAIQARDRMGQKFEQGEFDYRVPLSEAAEAANAGPNNKKVNVVMMGPGKKGKKKAVASGSKKVTTEETVNNENTIVDDEEMMDEEGPASTNEAIINGEVNTVNDAMDMDTALTNNGEMETAITNEQEIMDTEDAAATNDEEMAMKEDTTCANDEETMKEDDNAINHEETMKEDDTITGKVDSPATSKVDGPATGKGDGPATSKVDGPATGKIDGPATSKGDGPATSKIDTPATSKIDAPATSKVDGPATSKVDGPATGKIDDPATSKVDSPATGHHEQMMDSEGEMILSAEEDDGLI